MGVRTTILKARNKSWNGMKKTNGTKKKKKRKESRIFKRKIKLNRFRTPTTCNQVTWKDKEAGLQLSKQNTG